MARWAWRGSHNRISKFSKSNERNVVHQNVVHQNVVHARSAIPAASAGAAASDLINGYHESLKQQALSGPGSLPSRACLARGSSGILALAPFRVASPVFRLRARCTVTEPFQIARAYYNPTFPMQGGCQRHIYYTWAKCRILPRARVPPAEMSPAKEGEGTQGSVRLALDRGGDQRNEREGKGVALRRCSDASQLVHLTHQWTCSVTVPRLPRHGSRPLKSARTQDKQITNMVSPGSFPLQS